MSLENNEKQVDEILERGLAAYGECDAPGDLEDGILRKMRTVGSRRRPAMIWLPAFALAAALLAGVVLIRDWREAPAPKATVVQAPAPAPVRTTPSVERHRPVDIAAPNGFQRRPIARKAKASGPRVPAEESPISPLPQSALAFSVIPSSPIEIEALSKETGPLIPDLADDDSSREGGREQ